VGAKLGLVLLEQAGIGFRLYKLLIQAMTPGELLTYNVPLSLLNAFVGRCVIVRSGDPAAVVQDVLPQHLTGLVALQLLDISAPLDERETKWVIGRMDFFVGARMHACIAALSQGVPAVGLAYSDKFLGVFESAGVGSVVIDLRKMEQSEVIDKTLSAFERRAALQERLLSRIAGIQDEVEQAFRGLLMTPIGMGQS